MKYIEDYIEQKLKIKILGELTFEELQDTCEGGYYGVELVIDGYRPGNRPGIQVWYVDYLNWLEEVKIPELLGKK